jgi:hypothetical protein
MKIRLTWPPEPHTRYAQDGFDANIGKRIKLNVEGIDTAFPAVLVAANVGEDGKGAEFEFEITDPAACVVLSAYVATGAVNNLSIVSDD